VPGGTYGGVTATQGDVIWPDGDVSAKTVTVALNPATLAAGQSGTFQMEIFDATNASLETAAGASATTLPVTVTVRDAVTAVISTDPPVAPPPSQGGKSGGGGATDLLWLLALGLLFAAYLRTRRAVDPRRATLQHRAPLRSPPWTSESPSPDRRTRRP
jgi:hypothetical protein